MICGPLPVPVGCQMLHPPVRTVLHLWLITIHVVRPTSYHRRAAAQRDFMTAGREQMVSLLVTRTPCNSTAAINIRFNLYEVHQIVQSMPCARND